MTTEEKLETVKREIEELIDWNRNLSRDCMCVFEKHKDDDSEINKYWSSCYQHQAFLRDSFVDALKQILETIDGDTK
jgi:hypothetical protein